MASRVSRDSREQQAQLLSSVSSSQSIHESHGAATRSTTRASATSIRRSPVNDFHGSSDNEISHDSASLSQKRSHDPKPEQTPKSQDVPSSSTAGFFQAAPQLGNLLLSDAALLRALSLFAPSSLLQSSLPSLTTFADSVLSPQILRLMTSAEAHPPYVQQFDTFGRRADNLVTSEGWRGLQNFGIKEGMVAQPYENTEGEFSRVLWAARYILWCGSACWVNCPSLMVDGVAALLRRHLTGDGQLMTPKQRAVLKSAYERLTSRDVEQAWTTGQWMTERQGGSDVSMTETIATWDPEAAEKHKTDAVVASDGMELGPWRLDGFKWFSSATDANMVVMLARTQKGVSLFYAPMRRTLADGKRGTELNGVKIQRLKNKVGTRALPTAELELQGMRGWLIGEDGRGTKEIATVLNIARVHNGLTAVGLWGRGLAVVRAFAKVRIVGRRPLWERTSYIRTLSRMHSEYRANVLFNFFVAGLLGCVEQDQIAAFEGNPSKQPQISQVPGVKDATMAEWLLRLLTPALKGHCSKNAISGLQECMESLGGLGYLENDDAQFNVARLWRDSAVLPIWEGTTDMMADDTVIRVLAGKTKEPAMVALSAWVHALLERTTHLDKESNTVWSWWLDLTQLLDKAPKAQLESQARAVMTRVVDIVQGLLLMTDAVRDEDEVAVLVMNAWFEEKNNTRSFLQASNTSWEEENERDMKIVFDVDGPATGVERAKL